MRGGEGRCISIHYGLEYLDLSISFSQASIRNAAELRTEAQHPIRSHQVE